jgi:hypothetical protein
MAWADGSGTAFVFGGYDRAVIGLGDLWALQRLEVRAAPPRARPAHAKPCTHATHATHATQTRPRQVKTRPTDWVFEWRRLGPDGPAATLPLVFDDQVAAAAVES